MMVWDGSNTIPSNSKRPLGLGFGIGLSWEQDLSRLWVLGSDHFRIFPRKSKIFPCKYIVGIRHVVGSNVVVFSSAVTTLLILHHMISTRETRRFFWRLSESIGGTKSDHARHSMVSIPSYSNHFWVNFALWSGSSSHDFCTPSLCKLQYLIV